MKVEPTIVRADNGYAYATIEGHGKIFIGSLVGPVAIDTGDVPQLCECLTYAAKCPADARFFRPPPPKPLTNAEIANAVNDLSELSRMPNAEFAADQHNAAVRRLREWVKTLEARRE